MSYGTLGQVYGICAVILSSSGGNSGPSDAQITQFLTDRSSELDSAIASRGYAVPVVGVSNAAAAFLTELNLLASIGAAVDVWHASFINIAGVRSADNPGASYEERYEARLDQIRTGVGVPVGLPVNETDLAPLSNDTNPVANAWGWVEEPDCEPMFSRRMRW